MFIGRTDAEAEAPILWLPDMKSWLIGKDPDARKDWGQEEKGSTEDEMVGWHHWLNGHEFEKTLGDGEGQGSLWPLSMGSQRVGHDEQLNKNNALKGGVPAPGPLDEINGKCIRGCRSIWAGYKALQREVGMRSVSSVTQMSRKIAEGQPELGLPTTDTNLKTSCPEPCAQVQQSLGRNGHAQHRFPPPSVHAFLLPQTCHPC